jgi:hypothetical protein
MLGMRIDWAPMAAARPRSAGPVKRGDAQETSTQRSRAP